ncbi:hypothetical protein HPB48_019074 [Haemaphysalis longicornis]|uniref:Uncharacterized protein n=1 Tax=Haemaphysalis longicornis TaxID=44386 RepID=A0A9J6G7W3_HAELO|nr:hypothetical protein HPB48_019074 [Haemaphysalis longicornis]
MFFPGRMRVTKSLTMLDPFQQLYGPWVAVPLLVLAVCGEVFWTAAMLFALGDAAAVVILFNPRLVIVASTCTRRLAASSPSCTPTSFRWPASSSAYSPAFE